MHTDRDTEVGIQLSLAIAAMGAIIFLVGSPGWVVAYQVGGSIAMLVIGLVVLYRRDALMLGAPFVLPLLWIFSWPAIDYYAQPPDFLRNVVDVPMWGSSWFKFIVLAICCAGPYIGYRYWQLRQHQDADY